MGGQPTFAGGTAASVIRMMPLDAVAGPGAMPPDRGCAADVDYRASLAGVLDRLSAQRDPIR
jgi:hypothetical protein